MIDPDKKIDFESHEWISSESGIRTKSLDYRGKRVRLLELTRKAGAHEPCLSGHIGYIVEGVIDIEFPSETIRYSKGDGLFIMPGKAQEHTPIPITERVLMFMVEEI